MAICIIPARGGSKRIPRKNIRQFNGKPMIGWSIQEAQKSGLFDKIVVSTDDYEIAEIAKSFGAEIPFMRKPELADDFTGTIQVIADAIQRLRSLGDNHSEICCLYPTAPFVRSEDLQKGFELLKHDDWSFVLSATTYKYPIFRSFCKDASGGLEMVFPEHFGTRSQDLKVAYHDAGQFYWGKSAAWLSETVLFGSGSTIIELPSWRVRDIDTEEDWVAAEQIALRLSSFEKQ